MVDYTKMEDNNGYKIVLACINLICIIMHNKKIEDAKNSRKQEILKKRSVLYSLVSLNIEKLLKINPKIENSICFLFGLIRNY